MTRRYYRVNRFASKKRIKHVRDIIISRNTRDTIHRFEILLKVQLNFLTTIPLERQIDTKRFLFGHDRTSSPRNSPQPARVTRYVTTRQRNFDVYPATLLNFIMLRNTAISRNPIPIRCVRSKENNNRDSPLSYRRACRDSWYHEAAETRRRAIRSCTSALVPNARSKLAPCSCSCAYPANAWPSTCGPERPDRPPGRSAPPNGTEI